MTKSEIHNLARNLRKNQTNAEQLLWSKLRSLAAVQEVNQKILQLGRSVSMIREARTIPNAITLSGKTRVQNGKIGVRKNKPRNRINNNNPMMMISRKSTPNSLDQDDSTLIFCCIFRSSSDLFSIITTNQLPFRRHN